MANNITISGRVVAEPVRVANGKGLEFPLYDNERRKNRDTGEYEDTGNTLKLRVTLWGDMADDYDGDINKGDIIELEGSIMEEEYDRKDGGKGRSLRTTFVNSIIHKFKAEPEVESSPGWDNSPGGW